MPDLPIEIEIQRVMNLVRGFGWEKIKEEVAEGRIRITVEKTLSEAAFEGGSTVPS